MSKLIDCVIRSKLFLVVVILSMSFFSSASKKYEMIEWELPVKSFSELGISPQKVADMIGEGQFIINSSPTDFVSWNGRKSEQQEYKGQRVAYVASVFHGPADEIREMVWDMEAQDEFSPLLKKAENLETHGDTRIAKFTQIIKVPIIKLESAFVWQLDRKKNGDISQVLIGKGDVESTFQYWEFIPLSENETLVVLIGWQDTSSASLMYKVILEAEPALGKVFPLLSLYERTRQFKKEIERRKGTHVVTDTKAYNFRNINGFLSNNKAVDLMELKKLNELGSLMVFYEGRTLSHDGEILEDMVQVSAIQYLPYAKERIQPYLSGLEGLPEFNEITESYEGPEVREEDWGHLKIKVKIGPFPLPVHIYPVIESYGEDKYVFYGSDESYMYPLFGHIEHIDMPAGDGGTMLDLGIGGDIGPEASWVFKMVRFLPFHNVLMAATYGMLTADNAGPWVIQKMADEKKP